MKQTLRSLENDLHTVIYNCCSETKDPLPDMIMVKNTIIDRLMKFADVGALYHLFRVAVPSPPPVQGELLSIWLKISRMVLEKNQDGLATLAGVDQKDISNFERQVRVSISTERLSVMITKITAELRKIPLSKTG